MSLSIDVDNDQKKFEISVPDETNNSTQGLKNVSELLKTHSDDSLRNAKKNEWLFIPLFFTRGDETFKDPKYFTKGGVGYIFEYKSQNDTILLKVTGTTGKENKISHLKGEVEACDILQDTKCEKYFAKIFTSDIIGYIWAKDPNEQVCFRSPLFKKHCEKMYDDKVQTQDGVIYETPFSVSYTFMEKCLPYNRKNSFVQDDVKRIVDAQMCLMKQGYYYKDLKVDQLLRKSNKDVVLGDFGNLCNFKDGCEAGYFKDPFRETDEVDGYTLSWQMALFILDVEFVFVDVSCLSQHYYDDEEINDENKKSKAKEARDIILKKLETNDSDLVQKWCIDVLKQDDFSKRPTIENLSEHLSKNQ